MSRRKDDSMSNAQFDPVDMSAKSYHNPEQPARAVKVMRTGHANRFRAWLWWLTGAQEHIDELRRALETEGAVISGLILESEVLKRNLKVLRERKPLKQPRKTRSDW